MIRPIIQSITTPLQSNPGPLNLLCSLIIVASLSISASTCPGLLLAIVNLVVIISRNGDLDQVL